MGNPNWVQLRCIASTSVLGIGANVDISCLARQASEPEVSKFRRGTSRRTIVDWQLGLFRFGLFACVVCAAMVITQFDVVDSAVAIWNHSPTAQSAEAAVTEATKRQSACLSAQSHASSTEYPSSCYFNDSTFRGMPRDHAVANLEGFLIAALALSFLLLGVVSLGLRMARASYPDMSDSDSI